MKMGIDKLGRLIGLPFVSILALFFALVFSQIAEGAVQPFYIHPDSGTVIPGGAGTTNLASGNTSNGTFLTILSQTPPHTPGDDNTRIQKSINASSSNVTLGRAIFNFDANPPVHGFGSSATISASVTGKFWVRASNTSSISFNAVLQKYNSSTGAFSDIGSSGSFAATSTSSPRLVNVTFDNPQTTLYAGEYLAVLITASNSSSSSNRTAYVYCNSNQVDNTSTLTQSRIIAEVRFNISSLVSPDTDYNVRGTITPHGVTNPVDAFSNQNIDIVYLPGYNIQSLLVDGASVPAAVGQTNYTYSFNSVNSDHTISVAFTTATGTFNISPGSGGGINYMGLGHTPAVPYDFPGGSTVTYSGFCGTYPFRVIPNAGYGIQSVLVDGADQGVQLGLTTYFDITVNMCVNNTLSAIFQPYITVTSSAGTGGNISPAGSTNVFSGGALTFDVTPDNGYRIFSITDNGVNKGNTSPYTITNVTSAHDVVASFLQTHTISAVAGPNGSISPIGDAVVDHGSSRNFSITPNMGYRINDVLVDGTSVGALSSYTFTNVTADHTIMVSFAESPLPNTYCAVPPYINTPAPPSVMLMLSVESPMEGAANPSVTCTGTPSSSTFSCTSSGLGAYDNSREYYGYFDSGKCYTYSGSGATGLFSPSGAAANHQCAAGTAWSGNMLNWSTMLAVDAFRKAFTGGNRAVDTATDTVILAATNDGSWFPVNPTIANAELYMPVVGTNLTRTIVRQGAGIGFGVCNAGQTSCTVTTTGSGEAKWPVAGSNTAAVYSLRIKACDSTGGTETRCNSSNNKPEGTIQKYMDKMRFALVSYAADNSYERDGGVLRANMKWVNPIIPNGMKYNDATGTVATCTTTAGCQNPEREVETDGTFRSNPDSAPSGTNSGLINYINKFAYSAGYKSYDPMGEMYYEVVRYFRNLTPSVNNYCNGLTTSTSPSSFTSGDGFAYYCNATKTNKWGWRDPALYPCSQNFVIAVNDANPWLDKRIPGSAFTGTYGGSGGTSTDYCGSSLGSCDSDFNVNVLSWVNSVGDSQGLTPGNLKVGCVWTSGRNCDTAYNATTSPYTGMNASVAKYVTELGKVIGTFPSGGKYNSYNVAGLAYYAHSTDLRPDLTGNKHKLTTFMIDTQEPSGSMLVGPLNMLFLAAKFGGFTDMDNDQSVTIGGTRYNSPYNSTTCGGVSSSPNSYCSEWDANNDGYPDNYYFASDSSKVENSLNTAFSSILNQATSGTAAAVANNRSGERGANVIQAIFYPQWPLDKNIQWLGDVQALWFYLDPLVQYSGVYEDSDQNKELNLDRDTIPNSDSLQVKALWKAGEVLLARTASDRAIYTLLDSTQSLTDSANTFSTLHRSSLKPLLGMSTATDGDTDALINYVRGVDSGSFRSRTLTYKTITGVWKLGDIIDSTPQIQGSQPMNTYNTDYNDTSYTLFTNSNQYKSNNFVYVGANDGMLHAFRLGLVNTISSSNKFRIAGIVDDTDLGKEEWAFIPNNVLPYLKNCTNSSYCHQYLVDGTPLVFDASINKNLDCTSDNYWDCARKTILSSAKDVDLTKTSWRSLLIGSMGHGGASRDGYCNETLNPDSDPANNSDCIKTPVAGSGYSSYFALDITSPLSPKFMWELSDANLPAADRGLGLTTPGPAVVRINTKSGSPLAPVKTTNGRWFAVFASGPTGPIDQAIRQIKGHSDQNLKIYVVDLNPFNSNTTGFVKCTAAGQSNCNYWVKDTGIKYAFAHSLYRSTIDLDRTDSKLDGWYSDDVVYVTYTKATLDSSGTNSGTAWDHGPPYPTAWDKGGVLRLVTNNDPDPENWFVSTLIDDIGPVTSSVDILQDRSNKKLWVFFGEGRYFFTGDDLNTTRRIFGVADPCYRNDIVSPNTFYNTAASCPAVTVSQLKDQTSTPDAALTTEKGWYINLTAASGSSGAERLYGKLSANTTGVVFYPTFIPSSDLCSAGGSSSMWAVKYSTGGTPPASGLKAKLVVTTSESPIPKTTFLSDAFTRSGGRQFDASYMTPGAPGGGGGGGGGGSPLVKNPAPVKRFLNIQER